MNVLASIILVNIRISVSINKVPSFNARNDFFLHFIEKKLIAEPDRQNAVFFPGLVFTQIQLSLVANPTAWQPGSGRTGLGYQE